MKLEDVSKVYHNHHEDILALTNINLDIHHIGMTFIVGASGCGKTTLLNILSGKDCDFVGNLVKDGHVEVVEQEIVFLESMRVIDNLLLVCQDRERIDNWLERFQMSDFVYHKISRLSLGQKKRIQVIRSLLIDSDYLVCDEPTASLDYENAQLIMETLKDVSKQQSVIIVTHDIALVDQYADRVISMDKGTIINDQQKQIYQDVVLRKLTCIKKDIKQYFILIVKSMITHPIELLFKFCLISFVLIMVFVSTSLFSSTREAVMEMNKWRNSENIVVTQPKEGNDKYRGTDQNIEEDGHYFYYDVYDKEAIQLVKDNVKGVIGYRCGWTQPRYSLTNGSFVPEMTITDIQEAVKEGERIYQETGQIPYEQYNDFLRILKELKISHPQGDFPKDFILTSDFRNYEGFKDNNMDNIPMSDLLKLGSKNAIKIVPYQLYTGYELPLKYGKIPTQEHEVVLSMNTANLLLKEYQFTEYSQLINFEVPLSIDKLDRKVKISGISYYENKNENQVYFQEGQVDQYVETEYEMKPDKLKYVYVYFLTDPQYDTQEVAQNINKIVKSQESQFVSHNDSFLVETQDYQNPMYFYILSGLVCIGLFVIEVSMILMNQKRHMKEEKLLRHYGYSSILILLSQCIILFMVAVLMQIFMLPYLCEIMNRFVNSLGFISFVEYDFIKYFVSVMISVLIYILIEGGLYAFRTQKHS